MSTNYTTNNAATNASNNNANDDSNTSNNNDENIENKAVNAWCINSTTSTSNDNTSSTSVNENNSDNNNVNDDTFRIYDITKRSLCSARITDPPPQGHLPPLNAINLGNWNANAKINAIQINTWDFNSISRAFDHRSTTGVGNNSNTTSFVRDRERDIHKPERSYRGREQ